MSEVLVVDDHEPNLLLYAKVLAKIEGVTPRCFTDPRAALAYAEAKVPLLAVLDQTMPGISGLDFATRLRSIPGRESTPFLMVTATDERELRREAMRRGALGFLTKPVDPVEFLALAQNVLTTDRDRRDAVARAERQVLRVREIEDLLDEGAGRIIDALVAAMRARDPALVEHEEKVAALSVKLAQRLGVAPTERELLARAVVVHDVGKLSFSDRILRATPRMEKPDALDVQAHVAHGRAILSAVGDAASPLLRMALVLAGTHHERFDGAGYPGGLRAEAIPFVARIVAVADAYAAMTAPRPWRAAISPGHALAQIEGQRNTAYDPRVVAALREALSTGA
ncbi:MAG TPA: HD domain-containing phosphohydrolase [Candidatus Sulfotelmatobacter sp.]|nr:HD domain-containing phosphohydrolase [Candidatus Sulfotelmatobacter sp.]